MKCSRDSVRGKARAIATVRFEEQRLTSFAGLIVFQKFFSKLRLKERLRRCFAHLKVTPIYGYHRIVLLLVVHLLLGYRELRDSRYYQDDEMVRRLLGLKRLPDVATISRALAGADEASVAKLREENRQMVLSRLRSLGLARVTLDFDGSVLSTARHAEGTAVGYNKQKKGNRSYYPLFCTVAQTEQVLDLHHRPGNVHDSNGAKAFILQCLDEVTHALPAARREVRIDSAFFHDEIADALDAQGIEFTVSVPFERFAELKAMIQSRQRWHRLGDGLAYFESAWKPKCWASRYRFLFIRKQVKHPHKGPLQLDLYMPRAYGYEFKVILTNKAVAAQRVVAFHEGRGSQEGLLAHNLNRELQMHVHPRSRRTTAKRAALWIFQEIKTVRRNLLQRAGRIIRPQGKVVLSMSANTAVQNELLHYLEALDQAA